MRVYIYIYIYICTHITIILRWIPFGDHPLTIGAIQNILAWPLRKDNCHVTLYIVSICYTTHMLMTRNTHLIHA